MKTIIGIQILGPPHTGQAIRRSLRRPGGPFRTVAPGARTAQEEIKNGTRRMDGPDELASTHLLEGVGRIG